MVTVMVYVAFAPAPMLVGPLFTTLRSALVPAVVVADEVLFAGFGSLVAEVTLAVLTTLPVGADGERRTTNEKAAVPPVASEGIVQVIVPLAPTAGVVQVKAGPLVCDDDTNVVLAGVVSVNDTVLAALGPLLVIVRV